jgi:predicted NAD/FAD-dependent oxidoreductase
MSEALLVGNNLAVLVAAAELGAAGRDVVLLTDARPPGGHFRGMRLPDADVDIGMVLLEKGGPSGRSPAPDLASYQPRVRYDWTRFGALVDRWLDEHVELVRTPTPEVLVDGRRWPDHLIADRLDVLAAGGFAPPRPLPREDPRHAAGKVTSTAYDTLTYAEAAELNHGADVHRRLVEPFARKLLGGASDGLLARYHRAGWLPLFRPETLTAACEGRPTGLGEYPFWTTASGFVGELVRRLEQRLAALPTVTVDGGAVESLAHTDGRWEARTQDGGRWSATRPVLGLGVERVQALLGLPASARAPGASVVLVCCLVRSSAIRAPLGCLSVLDAEFTTYRVTDQDSLSGLDPEWHRVVVEAGPAAAARMADGEDQGDVRVLRAFAAPNAVAAPTVASLAADTEAHDALASACPSALLTGVLLGPGATSMNDQVVQGLAVAAQLG